MRSILCTTSTRQTYVLVLLALLRRVDVKPRQTSGSESRISYSRREAQIPARSPQAELAGFLTGLSFVHFLHAFDRHALNILHFEKAVRRDSKFQTDRRLVSRSEAARVAPWLVRLPVFILVLRAALRDATSALVHLSR